MQWLDLHDYGPLDERTNVMDFSADLAGFQVVVPPSVRLSPRDERIVVRLHKGGRTVVHQGYVTDSVCDAETGNTHVEAVNAYRTKTFVEQS